MATTIQGSYIVVAVLATSVFQFGCKEPADWGNRRIQETMHKLTYAGIKTASLQRQSQPPKPLSSDIALAALSNVGALEPLTTIGRVEPWIKWCTFRLETYGGESFRLTVASRPSLGPAAVVILAEDKKDGALGFYAGEDFARWAKGEGLCDPPEEPSMQP